MIVKVVFFKVSSSGSSSPSSSGFSSGSSSRFSSELELSSRTSWLSLSLAMSDSSSRLSSESSLKLSPRLRFSVKSIKSLSLTRNESSLSIVSAETADTDNMNIISNNDKIILKLIVPPQKYLKILKI